ncbi:hypothetical protein Taro_046218, partial [Colocasia esculenta]|nr:hypothetical protein [Colocasia esculenta]
VGFDMVDSIAQAEGISVNNVRFKSLFGKGLIGNVPVMLAKPQTFMNASGESVGSLVSYFKIPLNQVLLIYDDLDLPFASLRLLPKGGHGGHNGMRSVINHFKGVKDFPRLRIGIGRPPGKMDPVNFVLRPFNKKELEEVHSITMLGSYAASCTKISSVLVTYCHCTGICSRRHLLPWNRHCLPFSHLRLRIPHTVSSTRVRLPPSTSFACDDRKSSAVDIVIVPLQNLLGSHATGAHGLLLSRTGLPSLVFLSRSPYLALGLTALQIVLSFDNASYWSAMP